MMRLPALRTVSTVALLPLIVLLIGCHHAAPLVPMDLSDFEAGVLAELEVRSQLLETILTQMTIQVESDGETSEMRAILRFKRPDSFRLDVLDPLNAPMVLIRARDDVFSMVYLRESEGILGPLTDGLLRQQFGMDVRISDVISAIYANPFADGLGADVSAARRGDRIVIKRASQRLGDVEEIHVGTVDGEPVVLGWWVREKGAAVVQHVRFGDYREVGGVLRPLDARIDRPGDRTRLRFRSVKPEVNQDIPDARFDHAFPPSAIVKEVEG